MAKLILLRIAQGFVFLLMLLLSPILVPLVLIGVRYMRLHEIEPVADLEPAPNRRNAL